MIRITQAFVILLWLSSSSVAAESTGLTKFLDQDLREVPAEELTPLAEAIEENVDRWHHAGKPWYVWRTTQTGSDRFVVFVGQGMLVTGSSSFATIYLVDQNGKGLNKWEFATGNRLSLTDASFEFSPELDAHLVTLTTERTVGGGSIHKQYYALKQDQLRLVRIEDQKGGFLGAVYLYPAFRLGPSVDAITHEEWVNLLKSSDKVRVLSALLYVGGWHMDLNDPSPGADEEDIRRAKKAQSIRQDKRVRELVANFRKSKNKWIKEAAEFAATQMSVE